DPHVTADLAHERIELIVGHGGITPSTAAMPTSPPAAIGKPGGVSQETKQAVDVCGDINGVGVSGTGWTCPGVTTCPGTACASRIRSAAKAVEMLKAASRI